MTRRLAPRPSAIALKAVMAVSGSIWLGFLLGHLGTNLNLYAGPTALNEYYAALKSNAVLFWGVRVVLATSIVAHVSAAIMLTRRSNAARTIAYRERRYRTSSLAARTMPWTGVVLALFILYHLLHFTTGHGMPPGTRHVEGDDYANIVASFSLWYVALAYVACLLLLGLHLWHGAFAATLSLGLRHPRYTGMLRGVLGAIVLVVIVGMLSMPVSVLLALVR
jgi:succinate dehydrogenase cytochrome b subunit